jgi:AmmeMemoRadiSam system protein A/AmmeMemoRadiSam system protein B
MTICAAVAVPHPPLIIPQVGRCREAGIAKTIQSYKAVMEWEAGLAPDTVVVTTPHSVMYRDYFHISPGAGARGDFAAFGAPQVAISADYDTDLVAAITRQAQAMGIPAGTMGQREAALDHATLIPLYFLNDYLSDYKLVRIGLSGLDAATHYGLGKCIRRAAEDLGRRVLFIASGDLSHKLKADGPYGFAKEGPEFDDQVIHALATADFEALLTFDEAFCDRAAECGLRSFQIMAGALDGQALESRLYSYEGPFGVGYGVASFRPVGTDENRRFDLILRDRQRRQAAALRADEDAYVRLARAAVEYYVKNRSALTLDQAARMGLDLPQDMTGRQAGAFVTLHKGGRLRGCIGTIQPTTASIAREILQNAVSACSRDPRFDRVQADELGQLVYSVDVLGDPEPIQSADQLDVHRYGVIVTSGAKRGLLLPDLDGVDDPLQQIDIARRKAGISAGQPIRLERFQVIRHH